MAREEVRREACWTESLAVGSRGFVERIQPLIQSRRETEMVPAANNAWELREEASPYGPKTGPKIAAKAMI